MGKFQLHICLRHQALRLLITMRLLITSLKLLLRELIYQLLLMVKANQLELFRRANCQDLRRLIRLQRHLPLIPRQFLSWVRSLPILNVSGLTLAVEQNIPKKCASKDLTTACPDKALITKSVNMWMIIPKLIWFHIPKIAPNFILVRTWVGEGAILLT